MTFEHQEEVVGLVVLVPDELALEALRLRPVATATRPALPRKRSR